MSIGKDVLLLQDIMGYRFKDVSYLERALTHSSYTNEQRSRGIKAESNERLEFLGDSILGAVISEHLFLNFKKHREGALTKMRQRLVCEQTLAKIAERLELGSYIIIGHGEEAAGGRGKSKILADAMEAVIGAIYLDSAESGEYKSFILALFEEEFKLVDNAQNTDYKTMLQQLVEKDGASVLEYKTVATEGPEHKRRFTVVALVNNNEVGRGVAAKVQTAQMQAAKVALSLFGVIV